MSDSYNRFSGLEKGAGLFGVIKRQRDNDIEIHSNQTVSQLRALLNLNVIHFRLPSLKDQKI